MTQLDMFSTPAKPKSIFAPSFAAAEMNLPAETKPGAPATSTVDLLADIRGPRCIAWTRLLASLREVPPVQIVVTPLWTGEVVEVLAHRSLPMRHFLHRDGLITERPPDSATYLTIFLTAEDARSLHVRRPLAPLGTSGTHNATFRLAEPHEHVPELFALPEGT